MKQGRTNTRAWHFGAKAQAGTDPQRPVQTRVTTDAGAAGI